MWEVNAGNMMGNYYNMFEKEREGVTVVIIYKLIISDESKKKRGKWGVLSFHTRNVFLYLKNTSFSEATDFFFPY